MPPPFRFGLRAVPLALLSAFTQAFAQTTDASLAETVVTATRNQAAVDNLPVTVTAVTREKMDRRPIADETDLFRDDPDIVMNRDTRRHGAASVNIRGIEDKRIVQTVDGVRMSDPYTYGPTNFQVNNPLGVMPDFLRQVEIVRGPASSLYGSDALGGVVGYLTLNPADILRGDARSGVRLKGGWTGANNGFTGTVIGAARGEAWELLLGYSQSRSDEFKNKGNSNGSLDTTDARNPPLPGNRITGNRSKPNALDIDDRGGIAKLILKPAAGHRLTATLDGRLQETESDNLRLSQADYNRVRSQKGDDETSRLRGSLEWEHKPAAAFYDRLTARLSHQSTKTDNNNFQKRERTVYYFNGTGCSARGTGQFSPVYMPALMPFDPRGWANANCDVTQKFEMEQTQTALNLQFESAFTLAGVSHLLTYGADLMRQEVTTKSDTTTTLTNTLAGINPAVFTGLPMRPPPVGVNTMAPPPAGTVSKNLNGELYPLRYFPNGKTDTFGIFLQDEITLLNERLSLTPGIRYDWTRLKPDVDALAAKSLNANGRQASAQTHDRISPKLGWQWKFNPSLATYGQIASGFRAPSYSEVNSSLRNINIGYGVAPNPDLKPETSIGLELGLRARGEKTRGQVAVFDNRYKDFITDVSLNCPSDPDCIPGLAQGTTQYRNLSKVRIYGMEVRGSWDFAPGWQVDGAIAYAHGSDEKTKEPLNSVDPLRASFGISYATGTWGAESRLRAAKSKSRTDDSDAAYYRTPGYGITDLSAWIKPTRDTRVTVSINNLFDKKYWVWSDIRHMSVLDNTQGLDYYSQPGRNLRVVFQADF
ncbi:TonB-dependent hemoglobin/transferrin/lactoferrin family receptor [Azonexus sp.]|uniref:TonB-dependent hemoglobin/transferrin/lactoferrin family receptor n=1 Tax=Azonexus sp. TaxID=1872668 RepID=UPI0039E48F6D